jgi:hypothetical protein
MASKDDTPEEKRKHAEYMRAYYYKTREKWLARMRERREANPEEARDKQRAYLQKHAERVRKRKRVWRVKNAEKVRKQKAAWHAANPDGDRKRSKAWYEANKDAQLEKQRLEYAANPEENRAYGRAQHAKHKEKRHMSTMKTRIAAQEKLAGRAKSKTCETPGCGSLKRICFDHCHDSGEFRGWICHRCNALLGLSGDNAELLRSLADYLDEHRQKTPPSRVTPSIVPPVILTADAD